MTEKVRLLNIDFDDLSRAELLENFTSGFMLNPNVDVLMKLQHDAEFYAIAQQADWVICDSQILKAASGFLGTPIKEKISGSDFFGEFCAHHVTNPDIRIFLLGGMDGVAEVARQNVNARVGREIITHALSPSFGFERKPEESQALTDHINASGCTVLAIGVGCPKQEKWVAAWRHALPGISHFLCIGATIDFEAGHVPRAPRWMSSSGLEWLYRMAADPKRLIRRYLVEDLPFFWLLLKQRLGRYRNPFA